MDKSGRDICRACFVSSDPDAYIAAAPVAVPWAPPAPPVMALCACGRGEYNPLRQARCLECSPYPKGAPTDWGGAWTAGNRNALLNRWAYIAGLHQDGDLLAAAKGQALLAGLDQREVDSTGDAAYRRGGVA